MISFQLKYYLEAKFVQIFWSNYIARTQGKDLLFPIESSNPVSKDVTKSLIFRLSDCFLFIGISIYLSELVSKWGKQRL